MSCLPRLKMNSRLLNAAMGKRIVCARILPIFDYCSAAYTNIYGGLQQRLRRKLNACIRFIYNVPWFKQITPHRRKLGWLPLQYRQEFLIMSLACKMLHSNHDKLLHNNFRILLSIRD